MESKFPHAIRNVSDEDDAIIKKYYKGYVRPFVRIGPAGYLAMAGYANHAADIYNLAVRPDDIWVTSFSRSGTTWLQELVWLVANELDLAAARATSVHGRFAYIEYPTQKAEVSRRRPASPAPAAPARPHATLEDFRSLPLLAGPRYIKSHQPLSLLPPALLDTAKVLYIARDPRDVAVSFHFAHKLFRYFDDDVTFPEFWDLFRRDLIMHTPVFAHVKEAWERRHHPNMLFLFYEDLQRDLPAAIERVCAFLGREYSVERLCQLADHLAFRNMRGGAGDFGGGENTFFRKGEAGGWRQHFTAALARDAQQFMAEHLAHTDMRYPPAH